ncbi:MAG: glycosyltransferase [Thermodesulfobacteriota bacterium]|nr:glycosyltransferase [Thermodesulfobacteriota bacterium]
MEPIVSVIIPTYNRSRFLGEALDSALNQTYKEMEIIVVDDGSTDDTAQLVQRYKGRIQYIYQKRSERSNARNRGVRESCGEYIAFLDSDDLWLPEKIERQVKILNENEQIGVVYAGVQFIDENGRAYEGKICWEALQRKRQSLYEDLMTCNVISGSASSVLLRRECIDRVGPFDEAMNTCEDLDLWRRLAGLYRFQKIDLPLVKLRVHIENTQDRLSAMAKGYETILWKIWRQGTPPESASYKNEAIIKLLAQIASLYKQDHNLWRFFWFCGRSALERSNWFLTWTFWQAFMRLYREHRDRFRRCGRTGRAVQWHGPEGEGNTTR